MSSHLLSLALLAIGTVTSVTEQNSRVTQLKNALLSPCCYREPVSRHQSEEAIVMRAQIEGWVAEGKSDREILDFYKAKYGLAVLAEPEGLAGWIVQGIPIFALLLAAGGMSLLMRRWHCRGCHRPPSVFKGLGDQPHSLSAVPEGYRQKIES